MSQQIDFPKAFLALTGYDPFPWQERLYDKFLAGEIPSACDIPTGLGKTSVIAIWLIALAAKEEACLLPRKLAYVVNRRTIVDQSTDVVEQIRQRLLKPDDDAWKVHCKILRVLNNALAGLAGTADFPLAVSTLRGELADNLEWRRDPRCPAIIVGTVDMTGSKLLFSGYGDTHRTRPLHAGLIGCDTLFVHDEAHLSSAFGKLLKSVEKQGDTAEEFSFAPMMQVMELSATHRDSDVKAFTIDAKDRKNKDIKARLRATKNLHLEKVEKAGKEVCDKIVEIAVEYDKSDSPQRVVVYVRSPQDAAKIALAIESGLGADANGRVCVLSGEIRGYERDKLLDRPDMEPFTGKAEATRTVYLVATSAGEVGMDLHADHAVCDLSTLDSLIQRLGRVNRFGQTKARIDLVHEETPKDSWRAKTLEILSSKQGEDSCIDVCPDALLQWMQEDDLREAFSQPLDTVELTDILTDLWSQTSLYKVPARPEVSPWLHGIDDDQQPDTWVAWREEVKTLVESETIDGQDLDNWFHAARLGSQETLRMPTHRFMDYLRKKDEPTTWAKSYAKTRVVLISPEGNAEAVALERLAEKPLEFATVVLPTELGALSDNGFFDPKGECKNLDVADHAYEKCVLKQKGNKFCFAPVEKEHTCCNCSDNDYEDDANKPCDGNDWKSLRIAIQQVEKDRHKKLKLQLLV